MTECASPGSSFYLAGRSQAVGDDEAGPRGTAAPPSPAPTNPCACRLRWWPRPVSTGTSLPGRLWRSSAAPSRRLRASWDWTISRYAAQRSTRQPSNRPLRAAADGAWLDYLRTRVMAHAPVSHVRRSVHTIRYNKSPTQVIFRHGSHQILTWRPHLDTRFLITKRPPMCGSTAGGNIRALPPVSVKDYIEVGTAGHYNARSLSAW